MKQTDIKPCAFCGRGLAHSGHPVFYRIAVEQMVVNVAAVQRQHGLEAMLGSPALAFHMGEQADLAKSITGTPETLLICMPCSMLPTALAILPELAERQKPAAEVRDECEDDGPLHKGLH